MTEKEKYDDALRLLYESRTNIELAIAYAEGNSHDKAMVEIFDALIRISEAKDLVCNIDYEQL